MVILVYGADDLPANLAFPAYTAQWSHLGQVTVLTSHAQTLTHTVQLINLHNIDRCDVHAA